MTAPKTRPPASLRRKTAQRRSRPLPSAAGDALFRHLVISLRNGVIAVSRDGRVAAINEPAYRILGMEPSPADTGKPVGDLLAKEPELARVLARAADGGHLPNRVEMRLKRSGRVIGYTLSEVNDETGARIGTAMFFKDLTRVEQLEERERLRDRLAALGEMAAAIAHEVKNPLAGIEVMAGILKRTLNGNPEAQATLNDIINECKLANSIVVEVLEFVRPIRLEMEEQIALPAILRDAITMASSKVSKGRTSIEIDIPSDLPPLPGDPTQLRQLFTNLLTNAFEALEGKGTVWITARRSEAPHDPEADTDHDEVVVEIRDSGPGIVDDTAERVFSPFFTTKPQGTGLGLAIVRKVVDAHDGHIQLFTPPGGGTCFRVSLPVGGAQFTNS